MLSLTLRASGLARDLAPLSSQCLRRLHASSVFLSGAVTPSSPAATPAPTALAGSSLSSAPLAASSSSSPSASAAVQSPASAGTGTYSRSYYVGRLNAVRRDVTGKRSAQWARMNGLIPGLIYGVGEGREREIIRIYMKDSEVRSELNKRLNSFENTLYDMCVPGLSTRAVVCRVT